MSAPSVSVAVIAGERGSPSDTAASVLASVGRRRHGLQLMLVAHGASPSGDALFDDVLHVFPAGSAYARNRALEVADAPTVAFLDAGDGVGPEWFAAAAERDGDEVVVGTRMGTFAFPRARLLEIGGFDLSVTGGRRERWADELDAVARLARKGVHRRCDPRLRLLSGQRPTVTGAFHEGRAAGRVARRHLWAAPVVAGARASTLAPRLVGATVGAFVPMRPHAPRAALALMPPGLLDVLGGRLPEPRRLRRKAKTKLSYDVGTGALLHVHVNPSAELLRAVEEREVIRRSSRAGGIPCVLHAERGIDSLWVYEERMPGRVPLPDRVDEWFDRVAEWAVEMAGAPGPPLRGVDVWRAHRDALVAEAPEPWRPAVHAAAEEMDWLAAVHMHGDLQRANVLLADGVSAVDWDGAWLRGVPGVDLVYLALLARDGVPAHDVVVEIAQASGKSGRTASFLERVGIGEPSRGSALLAMLAGWAASERRRLQRLGAPPAEPVFRPLFERCAPALVGGVERRRPTRGAS